MLARFLAQFEESRQSGPLQFQVACPAHDDDVPSLSVGWSDCKGVLLDCKAECSTADVLSALDLTWKDLSPQGLVTARYVYEDEDAAPVLRVSRTDLKGFFQEHWTGHRWTKGKGDTPAVLYRLAQVAELVAHGTADDVIWIVEGEKDVEAIEQAYGETATCNAGGAGKWTDEHSAHLRGFPGTVNIVADRDEKPTKPGQKHALAVYESLRKVGITARLLYAPVGKDAADAVGSHGPDEFVTVTPEELRDEVAEGARQAKSPTNSPRADSSGRRELVIVKASEVKSARQRFLWEGRVPLGILALLGGRGGVGKSTFALWVAVELQHGRLLGDFHGKPMPFLYVGIEDDWETQVKPRLQAAGADMDLALFVKVTETVDETTGDRVPDLAQDMPLIEGALAEYGPCLMIVDPLPSLIQDDDHRRNVVRAALDPLLLVMARTRSTVFGIMHTKKGGGSANDLLSGSHAYYDAARAVLLFAKDDESGHVIMSQAKGNYASDETTGSLAYRLVSTPVELDDYTVQDYARVEIVGASALSVEEIVNRDPLREDVGARSRWIVEHLRAQGGSVAMSDVVAAADDENGWTERQMKAARAKCSPRVASKKQTGVMNGVWFWCLEGAEPPPAEEEHPDDEESESRARTDSSDSSGKSEDSSGRREEVDRRDGEVALAEPPAEESEADTQESSAIPEEDQGDALGEKQDSSGRAMKLRLPSTHRPPSP